MVLHWKKPYILEIIIELLMDKMIWSMRFDLKNMGTGVMWGAVVEVK